MRMRFIPDEPITKGQDDQLGFSDFAKLIQISIYHTETPFVYGVLGDWGVGKTSILRLVENRLNQDLESGAHAFVPIWFNAWQYENETNIIYPLLHAVKRNYDSRADALDETREFGVKFLQAVATSALVLADVGLRVATKHLTGEAIKFEDIEKQLDAIKEHPGKMASVLDEWGDRVAKLHDAFDALLAAYAMTVAKHHKTAKDDVRFVILIDDLDRCLPETTIAVLESIKNYLAVKNCVFVLGLNSRVVYQAIRIKYKGLAIDGREYLEKILNYTFYVPEPDPKRIAEFGERQIDSLLMEDEDRERYSGFSREFGKILKECHFSNPRKIKRICNRYLFFIGSYDESALSKFAIPNIIRLIVLAEFFPNLFRLLLEDAETTSEILSQLKNGFDVGQFETRFGVTISDDVAKIKRMRKLFELNSGGGDYKSLDEHIQAVFAITRLI